MLITKENGEREEFDETKLRSSLRRAHADDETVDFIVKHIQEEMVEGMSTTDIYHHAFNLLKRGTDRPIAARYSLKRSVMQLGPSGFPFEALLSEIYRKKGYTTKAGVHLQGKCARHEIDIVFYNDSEFLAGEAKFHNRSGFKTDLKTALYIQARWKDLEETDYDGHATGKIKRAFLLITNTKFTQNAIEFAKCSGLTLIGWSYPHKGNLEDLIDETALHPVTCLSTLTDDDKRTFFQEGIVLCRDIKGNKERLDKLGFKPERIKEILDEADRLCIPREFSQNPQ